MNLFFKSNAGRFDDPQHALLATLATPLPGLLYMGYIIVSCAFVFNLLCIIAVLKSKEFGLQGHRLFIVSLTASDLFICFCEALYYSIEYLCTQSPTQQMQRSDILRGNASLLRNSTEIHESQVFFAEELIGALITSSYAVTFLNITFMAVDHYVGVFRPFEYEKIMSRRNSLLLIISVWLGGFLVGFSKWLIFNPFIWNDTDTKLGYFHWLESDQLYHSEVLLWPISIFSYICIFYIYMRIYRRITRTDHLEEGGRRVVETNVKSVVTTATILGIFLICCLPWLSFQIVMMFLIHGRLNPEHIVRPMNTENTSQVNCSSNAGVLSEDAYSDKKNDLRTAFLMGQIFNLLLTANALLDPFIYTLRVPEIRGRLLDLLFFWRIEKYDMRMRRRRSSFMAADSFLERSVSYPVVDTSFRQKPRQQTSGPRSYGTKKTDRRPSSMHELMGKNSLS